MSEEAVPSPETINLSQARAEIVRIDKQIDANRRLNGPDRERIEGELFHERGQMQLVRDRLISAAEMRTTRYVAPPKCKACGGTGYAKTTGAVS